MKDFTEFKEFLKQVKNHYSALKDDDFAEKLGVKRQAISLILKGTTKDPGVSILYKMVNLLRVNPMWVFGFSENMFLGNEKSVEDSEKLIKEIDNLKEELREVNKQNSSYKDELMQIYKEMAQQNKNAPGKERLGKD